MSKMKLSSNMIRFYKVFGMKGMIDLFSEVGFEAIDFNLDLKEFHDGTYGKDFYTEIKKYANDKGIIFGQTHAPFASAYASDEKTSRDSMKLPPPLSLRLFSVRPVW